MWGMIIGFNGVGYMVWLFLTWLPSYLEMSRGLSLERLFCYCLALPVCWLTAP
jgi:hypothetical protein